MLHSEPLVAASSPARKSIRIGVSSCLLGNMVRYDGGHRHDRYVTDTLQVYFNLVPVCPEVELGMGTPREPIQLQKIGDEVRLIGVENSEDFTARMQRFARRRVKELKQLELSGFILKKNSPSCGMERVKVYDEKGAVRQNGVGLFAAELQAQLPNLPVEEEGRLSDPRFRQNWIERVFAYHAVREVWQSRWRVADLERFHARYKYVLLAHDEKIYRQLGKLLAQPHVPSRAELREQYESLFMHAMKRRATPSQHADVLQRMLAIMKGKLPAEVQREILERIEEYRRNLVPRIVPLTLIGHYARRLDIDELRDQVYLDPPLEELALCHRV